MTVAGRWLLAALALFVAGQVATLGYGTRINDVPYVAQYRVDPAAARGSALDREVVVAAPTARQETLDLWMLRFKLYSVESDEVNNIVALARMRPGDLQFDPGFYQYGGAYLYPLGAWFYALNKAGVLAIGPLDTLLANPDAMDRIWTFGRLFVLLAVALSALPLYFAARAVRSGATAAWLTALYLVCPATVAYAEILKPHWYALLWINLALLMLIRAAVRGRLTGGREIVLAGALGFAVGSALTFAVFAVFAWIALLGLAWKRDVSIATLIRVPLLAVVVFALTNPYYLLNRHGVEIEGMALEGWYRPEFHGWALVDFFVNSALPGLGIALAAALLVGALFALARPGPARWLGAALLVSLAITGMVTANMSDWHVNLRLAPYALPIGLLLLAAQGWPRRAIAALVVLTAAQAVPIKLAYLDENDTGRSTRLAAAAWIDANVPANDRVCLNTATPAPYDTPPFALGNYRINEDPCGWVVRMEREPDNVVIPAGFALVQRWTPRLSPESFPLVFGHINPQISIYRRG